MIFAQGDECACREAEGMFPGIVTACVKRATGPDTCEGPDAASARELTAEKVAYAVRKLRCGPWEAFRPALPMTVAIRMTTAQKAEEVAARPGVRRVDEFTVQTEIARHCDVVRWIASAGLDLEAPH